MSHRDSVMGCELHQKEEEEEEVAQKHTHAARESERGKHSAIERVVRKTEAKYYDSA